MIQNTVLFAKQLLSLGGFKVTGVPKKVYQALLTGFSSMLDEEIVVLEPILKRLKSFGNGALVIDDTTNPKYGLKEWTRKLKITGTSGYQQGYKVLLFLWESSLGRIPVAFALWHKGSQSMNELALEGLSRLRNRYEVKPKVVLADGAFSTDNMFKRLEGYGWPTVMRFKNNRKLDSLGIRQWIPRGYGETQGSLKNGVKLKVFRRKNRFFACNRMLWQAEKALALYKRRWRIEETFRILKTCLGLKRCQQHSMKAQALFVFILLLLFVGLESVSSGSVYKNAQAVISGERDLEDLLPQGLFDPR